MTDFARGRDLTARLQFNGKPWDIKSKTIRVQEQGEVVMDQVNGEQRARTQKVTDGFLVTVQCYEDGNSDILTNYIANQSNEDAGQPQLPANVGLRFNFRDGSAAAYIFGGIVTLAPLDLEDGGRKEALMHSVVFHCQTFVNTQAA
jgi:hypothetical protein